jgi:uncharacterized C2H2 Zn-finger protein
MDQMTNPTPLSKYDINSDPKDAEFGQLAADVSSPYVPNLTWQEEQDEVAADAALRRAKEPKDEIHCPDCAAVISGRRAFRHHVKDLHEWKPRRITLFLNEHLTVYPCPMCIKKFGLLAYLNAHGRNRHGRTSKEMSRLRHPKPVVPDDAPKSALPKEDVELLLKTGMRMKDIVSMTSLSPDVREALKMPISGRVSHAEPLTELNAVEAVSFDQDRNPEPNTKDTQDMEQQHRELFGSRLKSIVLDDRDRSCFLYFLLGESQQTIAIRVFNNGSRRPHVQKIVNRAKARFLRYQAVSRKNKPQEDWELTVTKLLKKR